MSGKQKLELTWVGKQSEPRLEPRILIEETAKSYHATEKRSGDIFENLLIHGDNLLALKAIETQLTEAVKCIYIDPPFNTRQAFENYDDGLEHSIWLSMMRSRLIILHKMLRSDGAILIHIDDNELGYLIAITDEIFGRSNRISIISFKQSSISGPKAINPGLVTTTSFILYYAKDRSEWSPNRVYAARRRDPRYNAFIESRDLDCSQWKLVGLRDAFIHDMARRGRPTDGFSGDRFESALETFVVKHGSQVARLARIDPVDVSASTRAFLSRSLENPGTVVRADRDGRAEIYFLNGEQLIFYSSKLREIDGNITTAEPLSNAWDDILSNNVHAEGRVRFPNGKKPEALIKRILQLETRPGDLVLDSFAGSGTTAAVAHKMKRRWVAIELKDHAETHILPRLRRVVSGEDQDGASRAVGWKGGGGFRFCRLAPSLLVRDRWGNWVVSQEYNPEMLAEAVCKHMGYAYQPSQEAPEYWNHGCSSERSFIYVTTQALTNKMLAAISRDVGHDRNLLICCKAYSGDISHFANLTVRKIPQAVLSNCEWGRDDYSLRIANLPIAERDEPQGTEAAVSDKTPPSTKRGRRPKITLSGLTDLFAEQSTSGG